MMDYNLLTNHLVDEYKDVVAYSDMYKSSGNGIFKDIAREEMTHAKHIENILKEAGKLSGVHQDAKRQAEEALAEI